MTAHHPAALKLELAARGTRLDPRVELPNGAAVGDCRTIDLVLPRDVRVTVSIAEHSPFRLARAGNRHVMVRGQDGTDTGEAVEVRTVSPPRFHARTTARGTPMSRIATMRGDHLLVTPSGSCGFSVGGSPCRFCVEGARDVSTREPATVEEVLEVVRAAFDEGLGGAVYFNTSVYDAEDGGIAFLVPYIEAVRRHFDTLVATQVHPPRTNAWIERTYAMGVDAISYNLEIFDPGSLARHCIGRTRYIGRERYLEALAHAAEVFPSGTVWCDLVVGLDPPEAICTGIDALAAMGVVPVVSHAPGAAPCEPAEITAVLAHLYRAVKARGISMGWIRDLALGITPLEARHLAGDDARLAVTMQQLSRWRLGALAARSLARFRRRLRVRTGPLTRPAHR